MRDEMLSKLKIRLPAILLLVVTLIFWGFYDPYEPAGPALLENPTLGEALANRGYTSETNGVLTLQVPDGGKMAELRYGLEGAAGFPFIRLSGCIRTDRVVLGKYAWSCARLLLIQRDASGKGISGEHMLLARYGTASWSEKVKEFKLEPNAVSVEVVLHQIGKSGTVQFKEISALPMKTKASFVWFRVVFALAWIFIALLYFRRCRLDRRKLRILILLNSIAILSGILMPSDWVDEIACLLKQRVTQVVQKRAPSKELRSDVSVGGKLSKLDNHSAENKLSQFSFGVANVHRLGHFGLFASLCFLVYCSAWLEKQDPIYYLKVGCDILLFSAISESLQYLTLDRTPGISDWLVDIYGLFLALVLFVVVRGVACLWAKLNPAKSVSGLT